MANGRLLERESKRERQTGSEKEREGESERESDLFLFCSWSLFVIILKKDRW